MKENTNAVVTEKVKYIGIYLSENVYEENIKRLKQMERHPMFLDGKFQYHKYVKLSLS